MSSLITSPSTVVRSPSLPAVVCRGLSKQFGQGETRVMALQELNLDVYYGQLTLLVGPSGCGKTTLISVIAGLLQPTAGELTVLGVRLHQMSARKQCRFRRDQVGFVFQQFNLLPALSAAENAAVPLLIAGWSHRRALARAKEVLSSMEMGNKLKSLPRELSGGQQQRVAIARALVHQPRLLVCDEPTSALDAHSGHAIMELIRGLAIDPVRAVIVVTHDSRVFEFGDRIVYMNDGQVERIEERRPTVAVAATLPGITT